MSPWEALILGIVQGATEFLPVSSSGHLVVAQELLDVHIEGVLFEVAVHVATLLSITLV
ncbi:MAG: undecaprenyl-diphosphate phosphatase, partial [Gemmatimonadetes bacterium]|nr:undecaprenyl-diphosphate phosphatase [Gemmatimonadota bacterium]